MNQVILGFIAGLIVGVVFGLIKLPLPAPVTLAGIMGIVGLFCGYLLVSQFIN